MTTQLAARDDVRAGLVALLSSVRSGHGTAVVLEGEAGIGKTSVVRAVRADPALASFSLRPGAARELEADLPLAALGDALGLAGLGARPADGTQPETEVLVALERAVSSGPVLLVVEDVHWCDPTSAVTLARISGALSRMALGVIVTARPDPRPPHVDALLRQLHQDGAHHVELPPLEADGVAQLATAALGGPPARSLLDALERAGGNPLYASELIEAYRDSGSLREEGGSWELITPGTPPSLRMVVVRRLGYLPKETIRVLQLAAVLGPAPLARHVAAVAGLDAIALTSALAPAYRGGLLDTASDHVAFRHVLIRDALYEDLPAASRRALHQHAAEALADLGTDPSQLAVHLERGLTSGDEDGASHLLEVAGRLVESAPAAAERYAHAAADALPADHAARVTARTVAVQAAIRTGDADVAETLVHELDNAALSPTDRLELWRTLIIGRELRGTLSQEDTGRYESAVRAAELAAPATARHLATVAALSAWLDPHRARGLVQEVPADVPSEARALVLYTEGVSSLVLGDLDIAKARTAEAVEVLHTAGLSVSWAGVVCLSAYTNVRCVYAEEAAESDAVLAPALATVEVAGLRYAVPRLRQAASRSGFFWGDHDGAIAHLEAGLAAIERIGQREVEGSLRAMLARLVALRGRYEEAEEHLDAGVSTWSEYSSDGVMLRAWLAAAAGDTGAAWEHAQRSMDVLRERGPRGFMLYIWTLPYATLARTNGDHEELRRLAAELDHFDELSGRKAPPIHAVAKIVRLLAEPELEHVDETLQTVEDAPVHPCQLDGFLLVAEVLVELDADERAVEVLRRGRDVADRCGATAVVARYDAALRELGVRRGAIGAGSRPDAGWDALTEAEARVVEHVVEGLTYREVGERLFISRRTVEAHIRSVFRKLDINSRNELTRRYLEHRAG